MNQPERLNGNSRRSRWLSRFALIVLLLAILHLIYLNLATNSPIQQIAVGSLPQLALEQQLSAADETCRAVAGDGNLAIHFDGFDASHFQQGLLMSQFYFRAVYALYPRRVFVGHDDQVINTATELAAADALPDDQWLRQHGVGGVLNLRLRADGNVHADSRAIR